MQYIAALDYEHLDNGVFLTTLARSLSQQQSKENMRSIIIHSDSEYTERIIQTGVMREQARVRSIKDLNNRLVALFADEGVSTVGINPNQREVITHKNGELSLDHSFLNTLPRQSILLLSSLVYDLDSQQPAVVGLPKLMQFLSDELNPDELFIFSKSNEAEIFTGSNDPTNAKWDTLDETFRTDQIPDEFSDFKTSVHLTTARDFNQLPNLSHSIFIESSS